MLYYVLKKMDWAHPTGIHWDKFNFVDCCNISLGKVINMDFKVVFFSLILIYAGIVLIYFCYEHFDLKRGIHPMPKNIITMSDQQLKKFSEDKLKENNSPITLMVKQESMKNGLNRYYLSGLDNNLLLNIGDILYYRKALYSRYRIVGFTKIYYIIETKDFLFIGDQFDPYPL